MAKHHPDYQFLTDYAAGSLSFGQSVCVGTHIEHCAECRQQLERLNGLGAVLMEDLEPTEVSENLLNSVLNSIEKDLSPTPARASKPAAGVPFTLSKLIPDGFDSLNWRRLGKIQTTTLAVGDNDFEVSLVRLPPGEKIGEHGHRGNELTVVLKGAFSDNHGVFRSGDFAYCNGDNQHQPTATEDMECICLTAVDAPVRFTGLRSVLNPFLGIHPA
ncbi:MAG: ChrR family anti-sigma-E factor [Pseudomonadales bacterium]